MLSLITAVSDSSLVLSVTPDILLPTDNGVILIGTEIITYSSNYMGTLYGCVRGAQSTVAASHSAGSPITIVDFFHAEAGEGASFTTVTITGLTTSRAVVTDSGKVLASSATTATELGYVNGVTSAIQTQLNAKQASISAVVSSATTGGGATESVTVAGLLTTSTIYSVSMKSAGSNAGEVVTGFLNSVNGSLALTFTADPGSGLTVLVTFK